MLGYSQHSHSEKSLSGGVPMIRWIKTISILATVVLLSSTLACDSKNSPSSPSVLPPPASGPASYTTAGGSAFHEFDELGEEEDNSSDDSTVSADPEDSCARGPGFYCQNQDGKNSNMSAEEFQQFAEGAAQRLSTVDELDDPAEVADAVCDTSDQLIRNLATLALNLESGRVLDTAAVGDAFAYAVDVANGHIVVTAEERKEVKRMLEQINEGEECEVDDDGDDDDDDDDDPIDPGSAPACNASDSAKPNKILVCHKQKKTLSISPNAWPAHWGHGDNCGACVGS